MAHRHGQVRLLEASVACQARHSRHRCFRCPSPIAEAWGDEATSCCDDVSISIFPVSARRNRFRFAKAVRMDWRAPTGGSARSATIAQYLRALLGTLAALEGNNRTLSYVGKVG